MSQVFRSYYYGPQEEPCPGCGAVWINQTRDHSVTCTYLAWIDAQDAAQRALEQREARALAARHEAWSEGQQAAVEAFVIGLLFNICDKDAGKNYERVHSNYGIGPFDGVWSCAFDDMTDTILQELFGFEPSEFKLAA